MRYDPPMTSCTRLLRPLLLMLPALALPVAALAHGVAGGDAAYVAASRGVNVFPFMYLGAKHMVTGYDHLLFLAGVIFFLYRLKDVALYVTLFAIGHSTTLLAGVLGGIHANAYIVDAIIGLSVAYKAFENLGGFRRLGWQVDPRFAVLAFGFAHGFGLATKLQDLALSPEGLAANLVSFNVGVELGQLAALSIILLAFNFWRRSRSFLSGAWTANVLIMAAGFVLIGYQLAGYWRGA
jgi:hypothetical protein